MTDLLTVSEKTLNVNVVTAGVYALQVVEQNPDVLNISEVTETVTVLNDNVAALTIQTIEPDSLSILEEVTTITTVVSEGPQGPPGPPGEGTGGTSFRPATISEGTTSYLYFGDEADGWRVRRVNRTTQVAGIADITNNAAVPDLNTAWPLITTLTYT